LQYAKGNKKCDWWHIFDWLNNWNTLSIEGKNRDICPVIHGCRIECIDMIVNTPTPKTNAPLSKES
jgi:hypothetical protein